MSVEIALQSTLVSGDHSAHSRIWRAVQITLRPPSADRLLRCAIYTRKSTEEGLEQSFNTLQAQREAGEAYILSHKQEGWRTVPALYDDGGWSGANLARPGLTRLLADVEARRVDCVVVYKVDRLSRSVTSSMRAAGVLEVFQERSRNGAMQTQFREAVIPAEIRTLVAFYRKVFPAFDWFEREDWGAYDRGG